jgi:hypothetical protein
MMFGGQSELVTRPSHHISSPHRAAIPLNDIDDHYHSISFPESIVPYEPYSHTSTEANLEQITTC